MRRPSPELAIARIAEVLAAKLQPPAAPPPDPLLWTFDEALEATRLTRPALRAVLKRNPKAVICHGRRIWIKPGRLREVLS